MKLMIPEISWHNRDPVLSVDIQPKNLEGDNKCRLASGGLDTHVLVRTKLCASLIQWSFRRFCILCIAFVYSDF